MVIFIGVKLIFILMVVEIIIAGILIAFGVLSVYRSIDEGKVDKEMGIILLIGIAAIFGGLWIIFTRLTLAIILTKLAGLILGAVGVFLVIGYPETNEYQPVGFTTTGVFLGIVFLIVGAYLLFF